MSVLPSKAVYIDMSGLGFAYTLMGLSRDIECCSSNQNVGLKKLSISYLFLAQYQNKIGKKSPWYVVHHNKFNEADTDSSREPSLNIKWSQYDTFDP